MRRYRSRSTLVGPSRQVNVHLTASLLRKLDALAWREGLSRSAMVERLLRKALEKEG